MNGWSRIMKVYPWHLLLGIVIAAIFIHFEWKAPILVMLLVWTFFLKDLLMDTRLIKWEGTHYYYGEHAPEAFVIAVVGILGLLGYEMFQGYAGTFTTVLALFDCIFDTVMDLKEPLENYRFKFFSY